MLARVRNFLATPGLKLVLVKAVMGSAGLRIAGVGFGFLVGVQLARGLGVQGYGLYGLAMSIIALITVATEFGLPQLLTREVAAAQVRQDWDSLRGIVRWATRTSMLISLIVAFVVMGWLAASGVGIGSALGMTLLAGLVMVPLVALGNLNSAALRGLQHIVKGQLPEVLVRPALFSLLLFVVSLLAIPLDPVVAMMLGAASAALAMLAAATLLRRELPRGVSETAPRIDTRLWWSSALPMALTQGMWVLQAHLGILVLGLMTTVALVGLYRVASSVTLIVATPITLFNIVSAPIISRLYAEGDFQRLQHLLAWLALGMTVSTVLLTLPFALVGEVLLGHVFGDEFSPSNPVLLILCVGVIVNGFFGVNATLLNMTGHHGRVTKASGVSLALLVLLLPPMIAGFGITGAAVASSVALFAWNWLMWRDTLRLLSLNSCVVGLAVLWSTNR